MEDQLSKRKSAQQMLNALNKEQERTSEGRKGLLKPLRPRRVASQQVGTFEGGRRTLSEHHPHWGKPLCRSGKTIPTLTT